MHVLENFLCVPSLLISLMNQGTEYDYGFWVRSWKPLGSGNLPVTILRDAARNSFRVVAQDGDNAVRAIQCNIALFWYFSCVTCSALVCHLLSDIALGFQRTFCAQQWSVAACYLLSCSYAYTEFIFKLLWWAVAAWAQVVNSAISPKMTFTKTSPKFGQWQDPRASTVYGIGTVLSAYAVLKIVSGMPVWRLTAFFVSCAVELSRQRSLARDPQLLLC